MKDSIYCPGQVANIFPYIDFVPEWFLLGGPADGDEAQVFHAKYPQAQAIGWEPNPALYDYQLEAGFPGILRKCALWSDTHDVGVGVLRLGESPDEQQRNRTSSLVRAYTHAGYQAELATLDQMERIHGPFLNAVLWLDIEGSELAALQGGTKLLARGTVRLINLEVFSDQEASLGSFLAIYGYYEAGRWGAQGDARNGGRSWWNAVYAKKGE